MAKDRDILVHKEHGDVEFFSPDKLAAYLTRIGTPESKVNQIVRETHQHAQHNITSKSIRDFVTHRLREIDGGLRLSALYNIKEALRDLGPAGYNFEVYVGRLFKSLGFQIRTGVIEKGECVEHEIDVVARKDREYHYIECKFHNDEGSRSDIVTALYVHARFADLHTAHKDLSHTDFGWLASNTKLSTEAFKYTKCQGINVLNLHNPAGQSIFDRVMKDNMFPITSALSIRQYWQVLLQHELVLLSDLVHLPEPSAHTIGIPADMLAEGKAEAQAILTQNSQTP